MADGYFTINQMIKHQLKKGLKMSEFRGIRNFFEYVEIAEFLADVKKKY